MSATRRNYLFLITAGLAGQSFSTQRTTAASTVSVTGEIESEVGASVNNSIIKFFSQEAQTFKRVSINDGEFKTYLESNTAYQVTFWHENTGGYKTEIDDIPLVYDLEQGLQIGGKGGDIGTYELPEGHQINIQFADMDGSPVEGLQVGFRTPSGTGTGPAEFFTNSSGNVYYKNKTNTGVELAGDIGIEVLSPTDHTDFITPRQISVTEDEEVTIQLQNPEKWGGTIVSSESVQTESTDSGDADSITPTEEGTASSQDTDTASGANRESPTETQKQATQEQETPASGDSRGFFTNNSDDSFALLNNPVRLTWAGIVASIVGIVVQLVGDDS